MQLDPGSNASRLADPLRGAAALARAMETAGDAGFSDRCAEHYAAGPPRPRRRNVRPDAAARALLDKFYIEQCSVSPHQRDMQTVRISPGVTLTRSGLITPMMSSPIFESNPPVQGDVWVAQKSCQRATVDRLLGLPVCCVLRVAELHTCSPCNDQRALRADNGHRGQHTSVVTEEHRRDYFTLLAAIAASPPDRPDHYRVQRLCTRLGLAHARVHARLPLFRIGSHIFSERSSEDGSCEEPL